MLDQWLSLEQSTGGSVECSSKCLIKHYWDAWLISCIGLRPIVSRDDYRLRITVVRLITGLE